MSNSKENIVESGIKHHKPTNQSNSKESKLHFWLTRQFD